ncbi:PREDICTED: uncharacterized protein C7orf50 homolog [Condylura cristata]|uniref:uncharacterized protein C7orf50 homolog n=1 Tax=Condylura cristata TaxID=143302 RepID=UPI000642EDF4|nr:PREDICTED: uncharacterized protein C7orf50 homolog [Condylura cristata]
MAKQKRKLTEVREKKNKKFKKASAKEAPEAPLGTEEACPEGEATTVALQETDPELSPEERRIQERKLKKERKKEQKKRLREAGLTAQTPPAQRSGAQLALDYLCGWAQKCKNWKFQKTRQTWLLLNMYNSDKVPNEHFSTLLAYLEGLKGQARELTVQKAEAMMQELDEEGAGDPEPPLQEKMQRVRQVLQLLS